MWSDWHGLRLKFVTFPFYNVSCAVHKWKVTISWLLVLLIVRKSNLWPLKLSCTLAGFKKVEGGFIDVFGRCVNLHVKYEIQFLDWFFPYQRLENGVNMKLWENGTKIPFLCKVMGHERLSQLLCTSTAAQTHPASQQLTGHSISASTITIASAVFFGSCLWAKAM